MIRRHPIRGLIFGLVLGLGAALLLISYSQIPLGIPTPWVVIAIGALVGLLVGIFGPPRGRSSPKT